MNEKGKFEEMFDRLPSNIKETEVLRFQSKKVLAALLDMYLHSKAKETKVVIANNCQLRKLSGIKQNDLLTSLKQLEDYDLITRKVGKKGNEHIASEYKIHFNNLKKPLKEKTFEDLFGDELDEGKSSETSMGTTTTITTSTTITTTTATATPTAASTATSTATATATSTATANIEKDKVEPMRGVYRLFEDNLFEEENNTDKEDTKLFGQLHREYKLKLNRARSEEELNRTYRELVDRIRALIEDKDVEEIPSCIKELQSLKEEKLYKLRFQKASR